jgi:hypothetical protein
MFPQYYLVLPRQPLLSDSSIHHHFHHLHCYHRHRWQQLMWCQKIHQNMNSA